jgi:hypothetical protein
MEQKDYRTKANSESYADHVWKHGNEPKITASKQSGILTERLESIFIQI